MGEPRETQRNDGLRLEIDRWPFAGERVYVSDPADSELKSLLERSPFEPETIERPGVADRPRMGAGTYYNVPVWVMTAGPAAWAALSVMFRTYVNRRQNNKVTLYSEAGKRVMQVDGNMSAEDIAKLLSSHYEGRAPEAPVTNNGAGTPET